MTRSRVWDAVNSLFDVDAPPMVVPLGEAPRPASKRMPARVRQADPVTSFIAAKSITREAVNALEHSILEVLHAHGPITAEQVARRVQDLHPGRWDEGSIRTRLRPLERRGLVKTTGAPGQTSRGKPAQKWMAA